MIEIKSWAGKVLYTAENAADVRQAVEEARKSGADLRGADLRGADLSDADLRGADLRGADLRGADLRGAYGYVRIHVSALVPLTALPRPEEPEKPA